jgi:hypothetical protein
VNVIGEFAAKEGDFHSNSIEEVAKTNQFPISQIQFPISKILAVTQKIKQLIALTHISKFPMQRGKEPAGARFRCRNGTCSRTRGSINF